MLIGSPAQEIKSKLKECFPTTKFSVTTPNTLNQPASVVYISWDLVVGSTATIKAVSEAVSEFDRTYEIIERKSVLGYTADTKAYFKIRLCPKKLPKP